MLNLKRPLWMILFGAPGVGKGTYGERLSKDLNAPIFSTGDYFWKILKETSSNYEFTNKLWHTLKTGGLVDDATVTQVIKN